MTSTFRDGMRKMQINPDYIASPIKGKSFKRSKPSKRTISVQTDVECQGSASTAAASRQRTVGVQTDVELQRSAPTTAASFHSDNLYKQLVDFLKS